MRRRRNISLTTVSEVAHISTGRLTFIHLSTRSLSAVYPFGIFDFGALLFGGLFATSVRELA